MPNNYQLQCKIVHSIMVFGCFKNVWGVAGCISLEFGSFERTDTYSESIQTFKIERFSLKNEHWQVMG